MVSHLNLQYIFCSRSKCQGSFECSGSQTESSKIAEGMLTSYKSRENPVMYYHGWIPSLKWITIICQDLVLHPDKKDLVTYVTKVVSCMQWHNKSFKMFKQIFKFSRCASKSHVYYFMILQAQFKLDKGE